MRSGGAVGMRLGCGGRGALSAPRLLGGAPRAHLHVLRARAPQLAGAGAACGLRAVARPALAQRPLLGLQRRGFAEVAATLKAPEPTGVRRLGAWVLWGVQGVFYPARWVVTSVVAKVRWVLDKAGFWWLLDKFPILKIAPVLFIGYSSVLVVFSATQKLQHSLTDILRVVSIYLGQFVLVALAALLVVWVRARHNLSMRTVHRKAFSIIENIPEVQQKLGKPITLIQGKRIEMRTGGTFKLKVPSSKVVNVLEFVTGRDIDNDGDIGKAGSVKPVKEEPEGGLAGMKAKLSGIWTKIGLPRLKYKKQRAHMVFPVVGPHKEQAMVCVECVKRPGRENEWSWITTPIGFYDFKLLSIDFADNTYYVYRGNDERYGRTLITDLRRPMIEW